MDLCPASAFFPCLLLFAYGYWIGGLVKSIKIGRRALFSRVAVSVSGVMECFLFCLR